MPDKIRPQRKSPRLKDYNYASEGAYFITICTQNRWYMFGEILDDVMCLNDAGQMLNHWWLELEHKYDDVNLDYYVIMPNHLHGIVVINRFESASKTPLSQIVQWFKIMTTNGYIKGVKDCGWRQFDKRLWQTSFHDHIIRDEYGLNALRQYVLSNPALWDKDSLR